jgi:hypothetical protein
VDISAFLTSCFAGPRLSFAKTLVTLINALPAPLPADLSPLKYCFVTRVDKPFHGSNEHPLTEFVLVLLRSESEKSDFVKGVVTGVDFLDFVRNLLLIGEIVESPV